MTKATTMKKRSARKRASKAQTVAPQKALTGTDVMSSDEIQALERDTPNVRQIVRGHERDAWYTAEAEIDEQLSHGC